MAEKGRAVPSLLGSARWMSAGPQGVGVFDSGVGGLTVYRKLRERFPLAPWRNTAGPEELKRLTYAMVRHRLSKTEGPL